jgi:hypothetical protein
MNPPIHQVVSRNACRQECRVRNQERRWVKNQWREMTEEVYRALQQCGLHLNISAAAEAGFIYVHGEFRPNDLLRILSLPVNES